MTRTLDRESGKYLPDPIKQASASTTGRLLTLEKELKTIKRILASLKKY